MKWLEIIELRAGGAERDRTSGQLRKLIDRVTRRMDEGTLELYCLLSVGTDYSIHLHHSPGPIEKAGSPLGLQLASALREFGLVNHTVWLEVDETEDSD